MGEGSLVDDWMQLVPLEGKLGNFGAVTCSGQPNRATFSAARSVSAKLFEGALRGRLIGAPAQEPSAVAKATRSDVVVPDLDDQFRTQRLPFGGTLGAPPAWTPWRVTGETRRHYECFQLLGQRPAVEIVKASGKSEQRRDFREIAGKRLARLRSQLDLRAVAGREAAKPVSFRLELPTRFLRQLFRPGAPPSAVYRQATETRSFNVDPSVHQCLTGQLPRAGLRLVIRTLRRT
jgi:hypothetical protein